ncbi:hypothetical protein THAOC_08812 [Thalassiosira oceanica]|uniref:Uncharacterized protein n=1 Tax=Thalassiosira oceanica TaxID=159749 RepID=K0THE4_THAOC|nr:hypothetical protein THAOC_08812 [Thalassiosira oceanica]|eukprot:EJK69892.1 hypothetical protein THAOC_08812 [Thalassiosira oceanica]
MGLRSPGEAPVPGNESEAGPPAVQQTALHLVHGAYGCLLLVQKIKILKMDEDGAPSQPLLDYVVRGIPVLSVRYGQHLADHVVVLGVTHRTAGETPPPPPGLVVQTGAGHGARTAAQDAVLLAVQEAAEASAARLEGGRQADRFPETWCQAEQSRQLRCPPGPSPSQRSRLTD